MKKTYIAKFLFFLGTTLFSFYSLTARPSCEDSSRRFPSPAPIGQKDQRILEIIEKVNTSGNEEEIITKSGLDYGSISEFRSHRGAVRVLLSQLGVQRPVMGHKLSSFKETNLEEVFHLIDSAWQNVDHQQYGIGYQGSRIYIIPMGKVIGSKGESHLKIILKSKTHNKIAAISPFYRDEKLEQIFQSNIPGFTISGTKYYGTSSGGITYTQGDPSHNIIFRHLLQHIDTNGKAALDGPKKDMSYFLGGASDLPLLIEKAWKLAKKQHIRGRADASLLEYSLEIPMIKIIGTQEEKYIRIVYRKNRDGNERIVTAFPVKNPLPIASDNQLNAFRDNIPEPKKIENYNTWTSKAGLQYVRLFDNPLSLHTLIASLKNSAYLRERNRSHFKVKLKNLPILLDQAWSSIQQNNIPHLEKNSRENKLYIVPMAKIIGQKGERKMALIIHRSSPALLLDAYPVH